MIDLQGRFMDYVVARVDSAGRLRVGCANDIGGFWRWLPAGSAVLPAAEER
jgi:hypothetical protein